MTAYNNALIDLDANGRPLYGLLPFLVKKTLTFAGGTSHDIGDVDGANKTSNIFDVTGDVLVLVIPVCKTALESAGGGTLEIGVPGNTAVLVAQTTATNIAVNEGWMDTTPTLAEAITQKFHIIGGGLDIQKVVGTADITAGEVDVYCFWRPLSDDGEVAVSPDVSSSLSPSYSPSLSPSISPSYSPSISPSLSPSLSQSISPSISPSLSPSKSPSYSPSISPSLSPSLSPSISPSTSPSQSLSPSISPSLSPSLSPSISPSLSPSISPSLSNSPSLSPSISLSISPSISPSLSPSLSPSISLSISPSISPSLSPSLSPSISPSV